MQTPESVITPLLAKGEELLWFGQPDPRRLARQIAMPLVFIFPLMWLAVLVPAMFFVQDFDIRAHWWLVAALPVASASLGLLKAAKVRRLAPSCMHYAVTNQRVFVVIGEEFLTTGEERVTGYGKGSLSWLRLRDNRDGTGDIQVSSRAIRSTGVYATVSKLVGIPGAREVHELIAQQEYAPSK